MDVKNGMRPVHPGEILREELDVLGLSANTLARALGVPVNRITLILNGQRGMDLRTSGQPATQTALAPESDPWRPYRSCLWNELFQAVDPDKAGGGLFSYGPNQPPFSATGFKVFCVWPTHILMASKKKSGARSVVPICPLSRPAGRGGRLPEEPQLLDTKSVSVKNLRVR